MGLLLLGIVVVIWILIDTNRNQEKVMKGVEELLDYCLIERVRRYRRDGATEEEANNFRRMRDVYHSLGGQGYENI